LFRVRGVPTFSSGYPEKQNNEKVINDK
jgi:hypothetical protein